MIKRLLNSYKTVLHNFTALSVLQLLQLFVSFLTYPYLIKVLGMEKYGVIAYSQVLVTYMTLVVNYGFNATATKDISLNINNKSALDDIISSVFFCKIILTLICLLIYYIAILNLDFFSNYIEVYLYSGLGLIGVLFFPDWYFQGIERMAKITYASIYSRLISVILIFSLVRSEDDLNQVAIINACTLIFTGVIGLYYMTREVDFSILNDISFNKIRNRFRDGFAYFLSNIVANSKENINVLMIGAVLNYQSVAIYDLVKKIINILIIPCSMAARAVFPVVVRKKSIDFNIKIERVLLIYCLIVVLFLWFTPDFIWKYFIKNDLSNFKYTLYILSLSLPLYVICSVKGFLTLIAFGYTKEFSRNIFISVFFYLFSLFILIYFDLLNLWRASVIVLIGLLTEAILHKFKIKILLNNQEQFSWR